MKEQELPTEIIKEAQSTVKVRFQDCDPFGHLHNTRYIDYFLSAREDQVQKNYDFSLYGEENSMETNWVLAKTQISYIQPTSFNKYVLIRTKLIEYSDASVLVESQMLDAEGNNLKAIMWSDFTYINVKTGRITRHSAELTEHLVRIVVNDAEIERKDFAERVKQVKTELRKSRQKI